MSQNYSKKFFFALSLCVWVFFGFFISQYIIFFLWQAFASLHILSEADVTGPVMQLFVSALGYVLALFVVVSLPRLVNLDKAKALSKQLGIDKKPKIIDILISIPGYGLYVVLTIIFSVIAQLVWRSFDAEQIQQVGFNSVNLPIEYVLAFIALVIIPPIAEELLFRGYVFSRLREKMGFWATAVVVSTLFAVSHLQWNVGIDVFALSLVLCFLRERTGHIWAGVALHMIKNSVAYTLLFLHPNLLQLFIK